jgi:hypothetical protein
MQPVQSAVGFPDFSKRKMDKDIKITQNIPNLKRSARLWGFFLLECDISLQNRAQFPETFCLPLAIQQFTTMFSLLFKKSTNWEHSRDTWQ